VTDVEENRSVGSPGERGVTDRAISDYALLSDCHSAALVSRDGSVDWLCLPRFDSPSVFARLLGVEGGHWAIGPAGAYESRRRYLPGTLALETTFSTPTGTATLTEAMVFGDDERGHDIGLAAPHVLVRVLEVTNGEMPVDAEFAPRPEYGVVRPRLQSVDGGLIARGGASVLVLTGPDPTATDGAVARWQLRLRSGDKVVFALQHQSTWYTTPQPWTATQAERALAATVEGWTSWSEMHQRYEGLWQDHVHHSGRVLQALTYRPTNAIVAAPSTSLPEHEGGSRNWDYRYCWLRDASMTMQALWVAACPDEANRFLAFVTAAAGSGAESGPGVQIMYGIGGEHDLAERELDHLSGWRGSRPVRVGNDAWHQHQHDVFGAVLDGVYRLRDQITALDPDTIAFLARMADAAATAWREPDRGIWEMRGEPRHFLHSKLMCWVALDRAVRLSDQLGLSVEATRWSDAAETLRAEIVERGWNDEVGAFTQSFGSSDLDASVLMMAITGFLPASDPRMRSTIESIAGGLSASGGLIYRYIESDGLDGDESTFLLCSFWLAECWALAGEVDAARAIFEQAAGYANDVGLLAEEAEPRTGEMLGNFPQAFSHIGLVNAAWAITQAEAVGTSS